MSSSSTGSNVETKSAPRKRLNDVPLRDKIVVGLELAALAVLIAMTAIFADDIGPVLMRIAAGVVALALIVYVVSSRKIYGGILWTIGVLLVVVALIGVMVVPTEQLSVAARVLGASGLVLALIRAALDSSNKNRHRSGAAAVLIAIAGVALMIAPGAVIKIELWAGVGLVVLYVIIRSLVRLQIVDLPDGDDDSLIERWLLHNASSATSRSVIQGALFYEGERGSAKVLQFLTLMGAASVLATAGVLSRSTAVVIGAMLVAPLMTPLLAMAYSLAMGWPHRLRQSTYIAVGGILVAVGVSWVVTVALAVDVNVGTNNEIVSRTSPGVPDLLIALAAGASGAYVAGRRDLSSAMPGVAVAIALVPPLSVVGITLHEQDWVAAAGATLLFATNMLAIVVMGSITFVVTGVVPLHSVGKAQARVRTWMGAVGLVAVLVLGALIFNAKDLAYRTLAQTRAQSAVYEWVSENPSFAVSSVVFQDNKVQVVVVGPGQVPSTERLAELVRAEVGEGVTIDLQTIESKHEVIELDG